MSNKTEWKGVSDTEENNEIAISEKFVIISRVKCLEGKTDECGGEESSQCHDCRNGWKAGEPITIYEIAASQGWTPKVAANRILYFWRKENILFTNEDTDRVWDMLQVINKSNTVIANTVAAKVNVP